MSPSPSKAASVSQECLTEQQDHLLACVIERLRGGGTDPDAAFRMASQLEAWRLSAAAPASGGADAVRDKLEQIIAMREEGDCKTLVEAEMKGLAQEAFSALSPAPTSGSEAGGEAVAWRCKDAGGKWMYGPVRDGGFWPDWAHEKLALAKPASEPADGAVRDDEPVMQVRFGYAREPEIVSWRVLPKGEYRLYAALSAPASSSPAEEAQP